MSKPGARGLQSMLLLGALLLAVVLLVSWTLGLFIGGNAFLILGFALIGFVGLQFLIFNALGLRSPADEEEEGREDGPGGGEAGTAADGDGDWRAWRG